VTSLKEFYDNTEFVNITETYRMLFGRQLEDAWNNEFINI